MYNVGNIQIYDIIETGTILYVINGNYMCIFKYYCTLLLKLDTEILVLFTYKGFFYIKNLAYSEFANNNFKKILDKMKKISINIMRYLRNRYYF